jgi:hypothetical protein
MRWDGWEIINITFWWGLVDWKFQSLSTFVVINPFSLQPPPHFASWGTRSGSRKATPLAFPSIPPPPRSALQCRPAKGADHSICEFASILIISRGSNRFEPKWRRDSRVSESSDPNCHMDISGPTTWVGTRTDYSVGPWDYSTCAIWHLLAWSARITEG